MGSTVMLVFAPEQRNTMRFAISRAVLGRPIAAERLARSTHSLRKVPDGCPFTGSRPARSVPGRSLTPARQSSPGNIELTGPLPGRHACPAMSALPNDYDSDPERFLSSGKYPHDDVHPYVAARLARARARCVLDVGGGRGQRAPGAPAARPVHELPDHRSVTGHAGPGAPPCGAGRRLQAASRRCVC